MEAGWYPLMSEGEDTYYSSSLWKRTESHHAGTRIILGQHFSTVDTYGLPFWHMLMYANASADADADARLDLQGITDLSSHCSVSNL